MTTGNENLTTARSLGQFVRDTGEQTTIGSRFGNESVRTLRVDLDGGVWLKPGAAVAYRGDIRFERQRVLSAPSVKTALLRETAPLVYASGRGRLFCAHHGSHASAIALSGETIFVAWPDLLAFEESLECVPTLVDHGVSLAAGGLVVMRLSGHGSLAVVSHGRPLSLAVTGGQPLSTDPHATMAWSADLRVRLKTDLSWRSAVQHGGHEPVQMLFEGEGFVIVQPFEDPGRFTVRVNPLKRLASLLAG
jgi:uncharacterized protein (AIM24 family)